MPSSRTELFDPRKHSSVCLSVNDKVKPKGQFFAREEPLRHFTIKPTVPRPGTAPASGRADHDPCSPRFMDSKGRWNLNSPPSTLHSVTQPLSATNTLSSSVRIASSNPKGDEGNLSPVVALHSYGDSSPVVTSDEVIESTRYRSAQRSRSAQSPSYMEQQQKVAQKEKEREAERMLEQQRVRQLQDQRLMEYEQQLMQQQREQEESQRAKHFSSVLRPGSAGSTLPRPDHLTKSFPASGTRASSARPFSASMTNGREPQLNPYSHDPAYASPGSTWPPNMHPPQSPASYTTQSGFGTTTGRPGSARLANSFKVHNDNYYGLPKRKGAFSIPQQGWAKHGTAGHSMTGNMAGSTRSDQLHTSNGQPSAWEQDPAYGKEPSSSGPYAAAADNPFWPKSDSQCLKVADLQRVVDLGKGVVPSGPNAKLVGSKWKYIPRPTEGDVVYTDFYGPVGGGKNLVDFYGRAYGMDTAEFARHRLVEDFPYNRVKASMMGIQNLRDRPGLSMDTSIVHGPTEDLQRLERAESARGLHKINQHHNLRAAKPQGWVK